MAAVEETDSSYFIFVKKIVLTILAPLPFHINFTVACLYLWNSCWSFNRNYVWSYIISERTDIFTVMSLVICKHILYLHVFRSLISFISIL